MKGNVGYLVVASVATVLMLFAFFRKGEKYRDQSFPVPPIEILAYGSATGPSREVTTYMRLSGCKTDEVLRVFNKYDISAELSRHCADRDCIDVSGSEPFYSMTITGNRVVIKFRSKSKISEQTLERIATEISWAH